jgi:ribosome-binding protein aMBF1 (putative translation factor)
MKTAKKKPEFKHRPGDPPHHLTRTRRLTAEEAAHYRDLREKIMQELPPAAGSRAARMVVVRSLARSLREAREAAGLSLSDLAKYSGMDKAALSRLENGHVPNPGIETILRYVNALGKDIEWRVVDLAGTK